MPLAAWLMGCTAAPPRTAAAPADRVVPGIPDGWEGPAPDLPHGDVRVGWVNHDEFGVVVVGSGSCPPIVSGMRAVRPDAIEVAVVAPSGSTVCSADMAATTYVFALPDVVDERPIEVSVTMADGTAGSFELR